MPSNSQLVFFGRVLEERKTKKRWSDLSMIIFLLNWSDFWTEVFFLLNKESKMNAAVVEGFIWWSRSLIAILNKSKYRRNELQKDK